MQGTTPQTAEQRVAALKASLDTKKHTPTPWYMEPIEYRENGEPKYFPSIVLASKGVALKYCDGSGSTESILQHQRVTINSGLGADDFIRGVASNTMEACIANAAFIIEAVNSHEALKAQNAELAAALRGLVKAIGRCNADTRVTLDGEVDEARAALAKVKP